ncbi:hypothetical protein BZM27_49415 [Paraburkholderia steynii]|uniref:Uncharacterized protein n=1 Tax=Paraburkholderia steynii TaxID=1245441 RepID=A0A4R0X781_9BURK|nr:hypothetical protein BZM27_49415 [Paraburkholderia steynii]
MRDLRIAPGDIHVKKFRKARTIRTVRNSNSGAPKGHLVFLYAERPGHPTGIKIQTAIHRVQCSG